MQTQYIVRHAAACIFAIGAIFLAGMGKDGWGWCIVAAILVFPSDRGDI